MVDSPCLDSNINDSLPLLTGCFGSTDDILCDCSSQWDELPDFKQCVAVIVADDKHASPVIVTHVPPDGGVCDIDVLCCAKARNVTNDVVRETHQNVNSQGIGEQLGHRTSYTPYMMYGHDTTGSRTI